MTNIIGLVIITLVGVNITSVRDLVFFIKLILSSSYLYIKIFLLRYGGKKMILLYFKKRNPKESEKEKYSRIMAKIIPILIHQNKIISSLTKSIDIETKLTFK